MEATIGVILGALVTIFVSRYYFNRSTHKSLGIYGLLNSFVFSGIAPDVRKQLHFRFKEREVDEVQQLVFLVANDGQRGISNVIEPLRLMIPSDVVVLDATILHRHPESFQVEIRVAPQENTGTSVTFIFPLLNKGEFFVVKLLLSKGLSVDELHLGILANDIPRSIRIKELPLNALEDEGYKFEWGLAAAAGAVLVLSAWLGYTFYVLYTIRPELCPYPWSSFVVSGESLFLMIPGGLLLIFLSLLGVLMLGAAVFGGEFPPPRRPRFPLPKDIRNAVFPYRAFGVPPEIEHPEGRFGRAGAVGEKRSNS